MVILIFRYSAVKRLCSADIPIPSQVQYLKYFLPVTLLRCVPVYPPLLTCFVWWWFEDFLQVYNCAARAFYDCPAIISHRARSQNILKEPALNPEKDSGNTYRSKQYTSSPASGPTSHLYIMIGFATTPPTPMESEAGLRGRPAAEAPNKKIPQNGET